MRIKIDLTAQLVAPDGVQQPGTMAKSLGNSLANSTEGDALKCWNWARELHTTGRLDLDPSDFEMIRTHVLSGALTIPNWIKGQILETLIAQKL